jgi:hypothetical protein
MVQPAAALASIPTGTAINADRTTIAGVTCRKIRLVS